MFNLHELSGFTASGETSSAGLKKVYCFKTEEEAAGILKVSGLQC